MIYISFFFFLYVHFLQKHNFLGSWILIFPTRLITMYLADQSH
jgi:hypothetical protein